MATKTHSLEQMLKRAGKIAAYLELCDLRMMNCNCGLSFPAIAAGPTNLPPVLNQIIRVTPAANNVPSNGQLVYMITLAMLVPDQSEAQAETPLHIEATFWLAFNILKERKLSDADVHAFGQINGMMQVWPFWREAVYTFSTRMGLPAIKTSFRPPIAPFLFETQPPTELKHNPLNPSGTP